MGTILENLQELLKRARSSLGSQGKGGVPVESWCLGKQAFLIGGSPRLNGLKKLKLRSQSPSPLILN